MREDSTYNNNVQWLVDLRADHINLPEQDPVTITVGDIQERVSSMKRWTVPALDVTLTAFHMFLAAQIYLLLMDETHPEWLTDSPNPQGLSGGKSPILPQLLY